MKNGRSVAIDLGNNNTILTRQATCFSQPSVIVLNQNNKSVRAVGNEAYAMFGKVNHQLKAFQHQ
jgi:rod shape-determining protein MreB and related proteins